MSFLDNIEEYTRTGCGYASVEKVGEKNALVDSMPSFFLSETVKYLFLLFDENNFVNQRSYVFSTEAHPFDALQISKISASNYTHFYDYIPNITEGAMTGSSADLTTVIGDFSSRTRVLPNKCRKRMWWESSLSTYDPNYITEMVSDALNRKFLDQRDDWIDVNAPGLFSLSQPTSAALSLKGNTKLKTENHRKDVCFDPPGASPSRQKVSNKQKVVQNGGDGDYDGRKGGSHGVPEDTNIVRADLGPIGMFEIEM